MFVSDFLPVFFQPSLFFLFVRCPIALYLCNECSRMWREFFIHFGSSLRGKLQNNINSCGLAPDKFLSMLFTYTHARISSLLPLFFARLCKPRFFLLAVTMKQLNESKQNESILQRSQQQASVDAENSLHTKKM